MTIHASHSTSKAATWVTDEVRQEFETNGSWTDDTWHTMWTARVAEAPDAVAVVDESGALTRTQVDARAHRLAAYMTSLGVGEGDVVTLMLPNWTEFVVVHAAIGLVGAVVNPLLPRASEREMAHIMRTARSRLAFAAFQQRGAPVWARAEAAAQDVDSVVRVVPVRGGVESLEEILGQAWEERFPVRVPAADARARDTVTFTSGTESLPKGVVHSHQSTMFGLRAYVDRVLGLGPKDVVFMPSPICHASGLEWGLRAAIFAGAPLVLQDRWDPRAGLALIDQHRCTYTLAATPFVLDLVDTKRAGHGDGTSLRYVASGGAAIPRQLVRDVADAFGADLSSVFGSSETYVTTATRPGWPEHMQQSDGAALDGVQVAIADEDGRFLPQGQEGEIVTRGPHVFLGYLGDPDLTRRAFHGEWYRFGDLGRIDEHGTLHVTGRIKDIVIRGGENISVREVEELLVDHPAVEQAAVVGYPDARLGERCCAVIVRTGAEQVDLESVTAYLRGRGLATYKLPERVLVIDEMPMTATGKIRKSELRAQVARVGV